MLIYLLFISANLKDYLKVDFTEKNIKPGDDLILYLKLRQQLYISLDQGIAVMNSTFFNENSLDVPLPISIRKIDKKFDDTPTLHYAILIDGREICSYGYLRDVTECVMDPKGDSKWILNGVEDDFVIEGRGGCLTRYDPSEYTSNFKHGVRIDSCSGSEDQRFMIRRGLL